MGSYLRGETDKTPREAARLFRSPKQNWNCARWSATRTKIPGRQAMEDLSKIDALAPTEAPWRDAAISFYRGWIETIADLDPPQVVECCLKPFFRIFEDVSERNDARALRRSARHDGESNLGRLSNGVEVCGGLVRAGFVTICTSVRQATLAWLEEDDEG